MFKGFGYFAIFVFVIVLSQIAGVAPGFAIYFISLILIVAGVCGFALIQLPHNLDQPKINSLLDYEQKDLKLVLQEITELAQIIRKDGLLVAEAYRKNLKDKSLQYLVRRSLDGFEKSQLVTWVDCQRDYQAAQFLVLQSYFDRVLLSFPVVGLMGSIAQMMRPTVALDSALVPFLLSLFFQLLLQSAFQEKLNESKRRSEAYFSLLREGIVGIKEGIASEFVQEQLNARLGILP